VWARGFVFSELNGIPLNVTGWNRLRAGPLLRGEICRHYFGQFYVRRQSSLWQWLRALVLYQRAVEPPVAQLESDRRVLYVFSQVPHWRDFFADLKPHREFVRSSLRKLVTNSILEEVEAKCKPIVSIHVRHGDFRPLRPGEDFARVGHVRTPISYFRDLIDLLTAIAGRPLPVTLFSDGDSVDLGELLALPNVTRHMPQAAIADLLLMAQSKILVPSASSTFSYWAAFLSEAAILLHPAHVHAPIRPAKVNAQFFEGPAPSTVSECPELLRDNIRALLASPRLL
jgi:hypothetical protein